MAPPVAQVEHVLERRPGAEAESDQRRDGGVEDVRIELVPLEHGAPAVAELELVQVGEIPAPKGEIDRLGQLGERVARGGDRSRPERSLVLDHPAGRVTESWLRLAELE